MGICHPLHQLATKLSHLLATRCHRHQTYCLLPLAFSVERQSSYLSHSRLSLSEQQFCRFCFFPHYRLWLSELQSSLYCLFLHSRLCLCRWFWSGSSLEFTRGLALAQCFALALRFHWARLFHHQRPAQVFLVWFTLLAVCSLLQFNCFVLGTGQKRRWSHWCWVRLTEWLICLLTSTTTA